jgi:CBS domain-containing membrane protein
MTLVIQFESFLRYSKKKKGGSSVAKKQPPKEGPELQTEVSDQDIYEAMKDIHGYLDITPGDLKEVFRFAYRHAVERIYSSVKASDIMISPVVTVRTDTPLKEVAVLMAEHRISGLPVLDAEGMAVGVISEKDFLSRMGSPDRRHVMDIIALCLQGKICLAAPIRILYAKDIMTTPAVTVSKDTTVFEIMRLFSGRMINRAPVVDEEGRIVGIVSRADIMRAELLRGMVSC